MSKSLPPLPPSCSSFALNLFGAGVFLAVVWIFGTFFNERGLYLAAAGVVATFAALVLGEIFVLKTYKRPRVGWIHEAKTSWRRVGIKLLSLNASILAAWLGYMLIPEYDHVLYRDFTALLPLSFLLALVTGNLYIVLLDAKLGSPDDPLLHFGYMICGRWKDADTRKITEHLRSVLLRAYFLPGMVIYLTATLGTMFMDAQDYLQKNTGQTGNGDVVTLLSFWIPVYFFVMAADGLFAVIGYLCVFRALDADVRSTEPTMAGWISCLACYTPFFEILLVPYVLKEFYYNPEWFVWFAGHHALLTGWAFVTTLAMAAEASGTVTFGLRFSNLTYRGLMSSGLFRYTKHPQYTAKMINRFCVYVPFLSLGGAAGAAWTIFLFSLICALYYVRARTEENHLSHYPEYAAYAEAMNERSVFRFAASAMPFLRYSRDKALAGKLF